MKYNKSKFGAVGAAVALVILGGCLLSGTFVLSIMLVRGVDLTYNNDFYFAEVDLTNEQVWKDHEDKIKDIDLVGFELWMTNGTGTANTFAVYVADVTSVLDGGSNRSAVESGATVVLEDLPIAATGQTHVTYGQSFKYLVNAETLRTLTKTGAFKAFAFTSSPSVSLTLDSIRVIVTLTAGA